MENGNGCEICNKPEKWEAVLGHEDNFGFPYLFARKQFFEDGKVKAAFCPFCGRELKEECVMAEKKILRYVVFDEEPEILGSGSSITFEQSFTEESAAMDALKNHDRLLRCVSENGRTFREYFNKETGEWN